MRSSSDRTTPVSSGAKAAQEAGRTTVAGDVRPPAPSGRVERAVARVDLEAIRRNCVRLRAGLSSRTRLCAVVKADGYGHGAIRSAEAAMRGGATCLAVASSGEAVALRSTGLHAPIIVMGALTRDDVADALECAADVVLWDRAFLDMVVGMARARDVIARIHLKLDSGLGRLGNRQPAELLDMATQVIKSPDVQLVGLMTHFATADAEDEDYFRIQLGRFGRVAEQFRRLQPGAIVHAANSAAALRAPSAHFDLVRCGIAIYGLDPFQSDAGSRGLEPAMSLCTYVAAVRRFGAGASAGYSCTWRASEATWVATLPIGYGDGFRRSLGNNAEVLIGGRRYPVVGTVSMDNITVNLGPETRVVPGAEAVIIGKQGAERISAEELAARAGTINYEIACSISPRVRREWSEKE